MNLKALMRDHFIELDIASKNPEQKVAWCTSVGPAEILRAMGFKVFFPENHGAMLGASRTSMDTIPAAHSYGYSPDICSYLTSDIGAYMKKFTPLTKAYGIETIPTPDILVYNTNQCKDVMHWFEYFGREFNAPVFGIHSPNHLPEVTDAHIQNVASQFKDLISLLEKIIDKKMDEVELARTVSLSKEATDLWSEVLQTAKRKPSPISFFDSTINMAPIVVMRGTEIARNYYKKLLEQLNKYQKEAVPGESKRIYWEGMPIWGRLRSLSELFKNNQSCIVASTYCNSWIFSDFDPQQPLYKMAEAYLKIFINRNDEFKLNYIKTVVNEFNIDGVIFHDSKTCPNNSNSQYNLPNRLREEGVPTVVINGDLCDLRCFSDEQSSTVIEAFLETI